MSIVKVKDVQEWQIMFRTLNLSLDTTMTQKNTVAGIYTFKFPLPQVICALRSHLSLLLAGSFVALGRVFGARTAAPQAQPESASARNENLRRVVIVERQLLHYRVSFYNHLRTLLLAEGIELQLLIGEGTPIEKKRKDEVPVPWATTIETRYFFRGALCWQPFGNHARNADLVIVMHENKMIYNLWLTFFERPRRIAFWGHGANMQSSSPNGLKEKFKRWTVRKVDWWFAYTESSAQLVEDAGFPRARITVVEKFH